MRQETSDKKHGNTEGFRKLLAWQKADELVFLVFVITKQFPREELFVLTSQMRRAALSVPANIAEGYARRTRKEKVRFYNISLGSLTELEYYIDFSLRLKYLGEDKYENLRVLREDTGRLLYGLVKSLKEN